MCERERETEIDREGQRETKRRGGGGRVDALSHVDSVENTRLNVLAEESLEQRVLREEMGEESKGGGEKSEALLVHNNLMTHIFVAVPSKALTLFNRHPLQDCEGRGGRRRGVAWRMLVRLRVWWCVSKQVD